MGLRSCVARMIRTRPCNTISGSHEGLRDERMEAEGLMHVQCRHAQPARGVVSQRKRHASRVSHAGPVWTDRSHRNGPWFCQEISINASGSIRNHSQVLTGQGEYCAAIPVSSLVSSTRRPSSSIGMIGWRWSLAMRAVGPQVDQPSQGCGPCPDIRLAK